MDNEPSMSDDEAEWYYHLKQEITWKEAKLLYVLFTNQNLTLHIVDHALTQPQEDNEGYRVFQSNLEADYRELLRTNPKVMTDPDFYAPAAEVLARKDPTGQTTIAISMAKMLMTQFHDRILLKGRVLCDDPRDCDYRKGGPFITVTAEQFLFTGYVDSSTHWFSSLFSSRN